MVTPTPQEHHSNTKTNAFSPWAGLRSPASKLEFSYWVPSSGTETVPLYMETQWVQTPIPWSCLERIWSQPLNHGLSCCDRMLLSTEFICSSAKIVQSWKSLPTQRATPPASGATKEQFPLLGTALCQFLSP